MRIVFALLAGVVFFPSIVVGSTAPETRQVARTSSLRERCAADLAHFCPESADNQWIDCLRSHFADLAPACQKQLNGGNQLVVPSLRLRSSRR